MKKLLLAFLLISSSCFAQFVFPPAGGGTITNLNQLPTQAGKTIIGNFTSGTATPTAGTPAQFGAIWGGTCASPPCGLGSDGNYFPQGGVTSIGQLLDFSDTRTSNLVITTTFPANGSNVQIGNVIYTYTSTETITGSGSWCVAGGHFWKYIDSGGVIKVDVDGNVNSANVTLANITLGSTSGIGFPGNTKPLAFYTCGNSAVNQWDTSPLSDKRAAFGFTPITTGTGILSTLTAGVLNIAFDPTAPQFFIITSSTVAGLPAKTAGKIARVTDGASATDCTTGSGSTVVYCQTDGSTWSALSSGGGSTTGIARDHLRMGGCTAIGGVIDANAFNATGAWTSACRAVGQLGVGFQYDLSSGAPTDILNTWFIYPTNVTTITTTVYGYFESTTANTMTLTMKSGCVASGSLVTGGSQNTGTPVSVASTTANTAQTFILTIPLTGCAANNEMYISFVRSGTYANKFFWDDVIFDITRALP